MRMTHYLKHEIAAVVCCCGMLFSCGEKQAQTEEEVTAEPTEQPGKSAELIQHTHDGTEGIATSADEPTFKIIAEIYDAPALPLGEIYTSMKQLTGTTRKVAELTNLVKSGIPAHLKEENCGFNTEVLLGVIGNLIDVTADIKLYDLEMKFSTTLKFDYPVFYEMSMAGDSNRMHVVVLKVEKVSAEK